MQVSGPPMRHLGLSSVYLPPELPRNVLENPSERKDYHIFFVTGNPGCIEYYHDFLSILSHSLSNGASGKTRHARFHVYGHSLANFVDDTGFAFERAPHAILSLQEQIHFVLETLEKYVKQQRRSRRSDGDECSEGPYRVILVGHSVGTWVCMELLSRLQSGLVTIQDLQLVGLIALFPTITWISQSPSGLKLGKLAQFSLTAKLVGIFARYVTRVLPRQVLHGIVKLVTGFPENAAQTTVNFLCSHRGVEQALYELIAQRAVESQCGANRFRSMAGDEMREITEDRWDQSVWGTAQHPSGKRPKKLFFFFGENDHWVANHVRDELIAARGDQGDEAESWKPQMVIDRGGIPHSFCIRHSAMVAEKTVEYIEQILMV